MTSPHTSTSRLPEPEEVERLVNDGYELRAGVIDQRLAAELGEIVDEIARSERTDFGTSYVTGNGYYVRNLIWKDKRFHRFIRWPETIEFARALIGPRVRVAIDARIAGDGDGRAEIPWHIHTPANEGTHPWASEPQTMACLLYLDNVGELEGALAVLPGSHRRRLSADLAHQEALAGNEVLLFPQRGDMIITHGNLWHRTVAARPGHRPRRVLFVGYGPAWLTLDPDVQGQPRDIPHRIDTIEWPPGDRPDPREEDDLLGRFRW